MSYSQNFARKRNAIIDHYEKEYGIFLSGAMELAKPEWKTDFQLACDAQPTLITTPNAGIPAFLTTIVDPNVYHVLTTPNKAAEILGEVKKGDWTMQTAMFPIVEHTGNVSSYGDWNNNGRAGVNTNFPQRQAYLYQTIAEYGELELEREGLAKINWADEVRKSAIIVLNKFANQAYFKGIAGLQNYGLQTDPNLPAPIGPALKGWGGVQWFNGTAQAATPNEIYNDILSLYSQLVNQSSGLIDDLNEASKLVLVLSPGRAAALKSANTFNVSVYNLLKENFPNLRIETAVQYAAVSPQNPQGIAAGELMQLIAEEVEGQQTGFCAFNEKLRTHPVIRDLSSFRQKMTQGVWGAVIRQQFAFAQMLGI